MRDPYPELILDTAEQRIRALAHQRARAEARRAKKAGRGSRGGLRAWWLRRATRRAGAGVS